MLTAKLTPPQIEAALARLKGWSLDEGQLRRDFEFKDFSEAMGFIARVALAAEKMDHHPDWSNSYNRVSVRLVTHSAGGITQNDLDLAAKMDQIVGAG